MAASNGTFWNERDNTMSVYFPTIAAIGTKLTIAQNQIALATDRPFFFVSRACVLVNMVNAGGASAGKVRLYASGKPTGFVLNQLEHVVNSVWPKGKPLAIPLVPGVKYAWQVEVTLVDAA